MAAGAEYVLIYWIIYSVFIIIGITGISLLKCVSEKPQMAVSHASIGFNIAALMFMAVLREAHVTVLLVMMLIVKIILLCKSTKH